MGKMFVLSPTFFIHAGENYLHHNVFQYILGIYCRQKFVSHFIQKMTVIPKFRLSLSVF